MTSSATAAPNKSRNLALVVGGTINQKGALTLKATEVGGKLYVQSLHARQVGWMPYAGPQR